MGSLLTQAVLDPLRDGILPADTCAVIALDTPFTARSKPRPSSTQDKGPRTAPPPVPQIEVPPSTPYSTEVQRPIARARSVARSAHGGPAQAARI